MHNSGTSRRENAESCSLNVIASSAKQSNFLSSFAQRKDGLLRRIRLRPKAGFGGQEGSSQ
jgi:hypothetical protein